jgi:hypothetical protein
MTDENLLVEIRQAFAVPRPERFTDRDHCCECAEHDDLLAARDLDTLKIEDVGNPGWDPICFATDEAFMYLVPALARLALAAPADRHGWYFEQFLFHLALDGGSNRRLRAATPEQRSAILRFLRHVQSTRPMLIGQHLCERELQQAIAAWGSAAG